MKRFVDFLAPLGLVVMIGVWALDARKPELLHGKIEPYLAVGALLVFAHLVLRWDRIAARVGRRQMKYGSHSLVLGLAVLAILSVANYAAARRTHRWDLTKDQRFSLSDQTKKVLGALQEDVKLLSFQKKDQAMASQDRLKDYERASSRLKVEIVDPVANPAKARQYDVTSIPTLVLERGSRREKINTDSEQDITNGIIKVTRDAKKTICFVEGEGEHDPDDGGDPGYSNARSSLTRAQYEVQKVLLLREGKVPESCTVMVVSGPQKDLLPPAIEALRAFVKRGGKLLLMVEPELKEAYPNLVAFAKEWNVELGKDVVVDFSPVGQLFGTGPLTPLAANYPPHDITRDFRVATAFHTARTASVGTAQVPGVVAQSLVETSKAAYAETDLTLKEPVDIDEGKDKVGPVALAVVATVAVAAPEPAPAPSPNPLAPAPLPSPSPAAEEAKKEGRVIVVGDADFASNALLGFQGNYDFFLNTVAWLAQDADMISIRPRDQEDQRIFLTPQQNNLAKGFSLAALPGIFVVLGVASWWRRRG